VQTTRNSPLIALGASTRGALALAAAARGRAFVRGRSYCIVDDIQDLAVPALAHRLRLSSHNEGFVATRDEAESTLRELISRIPVPV
jgi:MoxR-like ATPase